MIDKEKLEKAVADFYNAVIGDSEIIITVTYNDGTTEEKRLELKAECVTEPAELTDQDRGITYYTYDFNVYVQVKLK